MQRKLRRRQIAVCLALTFVALIIMGGWQALAAWEVSLDGETIGTIQDKQEIISRIEERTIALREEKGSEVGLASVLQYSIRFTMDRSTPEDLWTALEPRLQFGLKAAIITVNGEAVAALATEAEAQAVIDAVKERFKSNRSNSQLEQISFRQEVAVVADYRELSQLVTPDLAENILLFGRERRVTHTVSRGESFWSIARLHNLRTSVLQAANPTIVPERLRVGAALNLVVEEPFVEVEVVEKVTYNQAVPFQTTFVMDNSLWSWDSRVRTPGRAGTQQLTARVTSVNGTETSRQILSTQTLSTPTTQVVARGTKSAPTLSTGAFRWPTTGRITSPFGPRWDGFHQGVDIGAPIGTPIVAADSGMVSFSGRNGGYGLMVRIEHGNGYATLYAHASRLLVSVNQQVEKGQTIALVGNTGQSFGPHLHFEIITGGRPVNPLRYFR